MGCQTRSSLAHCLSDYLDRRYPNCSADRLNEMRCEPEDFFGRTGGNRILTVYN